MTLALAKPILQAAIKTMLLDVRDNKTVDEAAAQLADAIHNYVTAASVVVNAGIPVQTVPATGTGATTSPGSGSLT